MTLPRAPAPKRSSASLPNERLRRLRRSELPADATALAQFLIGVCIVAVANGQLAAARILETEAYLPGDAAAHSFRGPTARNRSLFLAAGHAYVYFIYGNHFCLNVSAERAGIGAGVLLRAAEPLRGIEVMRGRRPGASDRDLLRGPGRLAQALGISRTHDGIDLCAPGELWLAGPRVPLGLTTTTRIGLSKETERPLRFFATGHPGISGPAHLRR